MQSQSEDTIKLLKECDAGTKMAVDSIDQVLNHVTKPELEERLAQSKEHHSELGNEIHALLSESGETGKNPNPMAAGMSWMKTNMMVGMKDSDATVADLITDGCDMGVKSLNRYLNQYQAAAPEAKRICNELVAEEQSLCEDLRGYL